MSEYDFTNIPHAEDMSLEIESAVEYYTKELDLPLRVAINVLRTAIHHLEDELNERR